MGFNQPRDSGHRHSYVLQRVPEYSLLDEQFNHITQVQGLRR